MKGRDPPSFTRATMEQCEHSCPWAVGPIRTAEGIVERQWAVCHKKDKEVLLLERTQCVKFLKSVIAKSI